MPVFSDLPVYNDLPDRILIPGLIEAENYTSQDGLGVSETTDINGGYKLGYTDSGDFSEYSVLVTESGEYEVSVRIASANDSGSIIFQLVEGSNEQYLTQISLPITGGWETWETVSKSLTLEEGSYTLRLVVGQSGFDINWIDFEYIGDSMSLSETNEINLSLTPNPSSDYLFLNTDLSEFVIEIYDFLGKKVHFSENTNRINIKDLANGMYLLNIKSGSFSSSKVFIKK